MSKQYPGVERVGPGLYHVRVSVTDPRTGKRREKKATVDASTAAEASAHRALLRDEALAAVEAAPRKTVADFAESWLRGKRAEVAASTLSTYGAALDQLDWLGDIFIDLVVPEDIVRWRDTRKGEAATVNGYLRVIKTLFADAASQLRLGHNPTSRVRARRTRKPHDEDEANRLTAIELRAALEHARDNYPQWYPLFCALAFTGARWGAVTALRWRDVDLDGGWLVVRRAQWRGEIKDLKAGQQRRIPMADTLVEALRGHRQQLLKRQDRKQLASGLVFPSTVGKLLCNGDGVNKPWRACVVAAGVDRRATLHGLRRTFNNLSRQVSSQLVTQALTGHVTDEMTEHYSFVEADEKRAAVTRISKLVAQECVPERVLGDPTLDDGDGNCK